MTKLSDAQRMILSAAAEHEMGLATAPKTLPAAARSAVFRSMLTNNLLTEITAPREYAGLKKRQGITIKVLEPVRQVGPGAHAGRTDGR